MSTEIKAFAAPSEGLTVELQTITLPALQPQQVLVKNKYCSICSSDIHSIRGDWGSFKQLGVERIVPSHEVYGEVIELGSEVTHLKIGDRVGIGWQSASCHNCRQCDERNEQTCKTMSSTIYHSTGGFGEKTICDAKFAFKVPDVINPEHVCVFMCAGITVFSPIYRWYTTTHALRSKESIEKYPLKALVYGLGGLGHIAVQMLNNYGVEVVAMSRSTDKHEFAAELGAKQYVSSQDADAVADLKGSFDLVLNTANSADEDVSNLLEFLVPRGTLEYVVVSTEHYKFKGIYVMDNELNIAGTKIGGTETFERMFQFIEKSHGPDGVKPIIPLGETRAISFNEESVATVNDALQFVKDGKARFRVTFKYE